MSSELFFGDATLSVSTRIFTIWVSYHLIQLLLFLYLYRDRLTKDDCIGTVHLPTSQISGQGGDGNRRFSRNLSIMQMQISSSFPLKDSYQHLVHVSSTFTVPQENTATFLMSMTNSIWDR